jgi:sortase (surface protein transpeptidase)
VAPTPVSYPASTPTRLSIPTIGVDAPVRQVGRDAHGAIGVPQPGPHYDDPAWYRYSPTPGQIGPAVIVGHIDSAAEGPSVFFRLGALRRGDTLSVRRADGRRITFGVDRVAQYPKDRFPTVTVYGATRTAQLRLITCGGSFDRRARSYRDNIVVYASLRGGSP